MEKRKREDNIVEIGDEVRLVNLPAYPGLEGLTGRVVSISDSVDVELHKTGAVKRVCPLYIAFKFLSIGEER